MPGRGLPTGVITFVFTDIEGSTHLLQRLGDAYPAAQDEHFRLLREAFDAHHGCEVGTRGDALFVAFASASEAIAAAVDAQLLLHEHPWPANGQIRVRMGMHTGEAVVQSDDYVGLAVHQAARICAAGHAGQILLSDATLAAAGQPPPPIDTVDLGLHRLKDLPEPLRLYQASHPDLPEPTSWLRLDAVPGNLPKQITSFVGRKSEQQEVTGHLDAGARLVTLSGPGGCGKTRLAIQVAAGAVSRYPQGAWLVDLAAVREGDLVIRAVAATLGVSETSGRSLTSTLLDHLLARRLLLILDNCEHLVAACAELADVVLRSAEDVQIVATSQEALGLVGETVVRVPPLPDAEAVELFGERAALRGSDFALNDENADLVVAICRRLDGIPLAIELAAARIPVLSLQQISDRLDDQFRLLTGGSRNALPRQQTLRAAVDWSYGLLSDRERVLLRRVAVFAGGWTIDAAMVVSGDTGNGGGAGGGGNGDEAGVDVLDALDRLVSRSLVVAEEQDGVARFRLLESIRQYAQEKLSEAGEVAACRQHHLEWFHALTLRAEPELTGPDQAMWFDRLAREYDNLRAAMEWAASQPDRADDLLSLAAALWRFWLVRGHWSEGRAWLERALRATTGERSETRARALAAAGHLATEEADIAAAGPMLDESLELWRELGDVEGTAETLNHQGNLARARFEYDAARGLLSEALALREQAGNDRGIAVSLRNLGLLAALQRDHETAASLYERALPIARDLGDKRVVATLAHALSMVAFEDGDRTRARSLAEEGLNLARALGDKQSIAEALTVLSGINACDGDPTASASTLDEAIALWRSLGARDALAWTYTMLGDMAISAGDVVAAGSHLDIAVREWRRLDDAAAMARVLNLAGWAAAMRGDDVVAAPILEEAVLRARAGSDAAQLASSLHSLGEFRRLSGVEEAADQLLNESLAVATAAGWRHLIWWPSLSLAALGRQRHDLSMATDFLGRAAALCPKLARRARQAECLDELAMLRAAQDRPHDAAAALGAADQLRDAVPMPRPPVQMPTHRDLLRQLTAQLGSGGVDTERQRGAHAGADVVLSTVGP
jgi:predicted ATPase/class 3 adenylate cyclase